MVAQTFKKWDSSWSWKMTGFCCPKDEMHKQVGERGS